MGQQLLSLWNFGATVVRVTGDEFGPLAADSWKAFKEGVPDGVKKGTKDAISGAVKVALVALAVKLAGPFAPIALILPAFGSIEKGLKAGHHEPS